MTFVESGDSLMKAFLALLALGALAGGIFLLGGFRPGEDEKSLLHVAEDMPLTVRVSKPERRGIVKNVQAPGDVEAVLEVEISSEIVAKIEEMPIEEGDVVEQGQLLCRLNDDNLRAGVQSGEARVAQLGAAIMQAQADLDKAERDCKRQARLSEADATTDKERFEYLTILKKAKAVLEMRQQELVEAQAGLQRVKEDLKRTVIESPIAGVISKLNAKQGEVVVTGTMNNPGTVIMTISDLSQMQVRCRVDEVDIPQVKAGQRARVYLQSDQQVPVPARVVRVASKGTKTLGRDVVFFETLLEVLSNDPRIKPAMTANVEIEVAKCDDALVVPVEAIVHRMRKDLDEKIVKAFEARQSQLDLSDRARQAQYIKVVYVMDGEIARVRLIEPGIADTRGVELSEGVAMRDEIIVGPYRSLDKLKDGKKVALSDEDKKKNEDAASEAKLASDDDSKEEETGDDQDQTSEAVASEEDENTSGQSQAVATGAAP